MEKSTQSLFANACKKAIYQKDPELEEKIWNHLCTRNVRIVRFKIGGIIVILSGTILVLIESVLE